MENLDELQLPQSLFLLKFCTCFLIKNDYNYINKNVKNECVETTYFSFLQKTQYLNKIKKSGAPLCRHCYAGNVREVSAKNIELYGSWSSAKFSIFQKNLVSRK